MNIKPPKKTARLLFIHHSCGSNWLNDDHGRLGLALAENNYFVSDTNYGWGPDVIGDCTYTGQWWTWFRGSNSEKNLKAACNEAGMNSLYSRPLKAPEGENEIILFKSCYPNSYLKGSPDDLVPPITENKLRNEEFSSQYHTVGNAKGIYIDLLEYFKTRNDKLFVVITAPPVSETELAENARYFNNWLVNEWLKGYPYKNVAVYDFYNVLTSNDGSIDINDLGKETGNHHRIWNGRIQHVTGEDCNINRYPSNEGDDHPSIAGNVKATAEFIDVMNYFYNEWMIG
jgi:hypothetical protein